MDEITVRKIDKLLNLMVDNATVVVSGEKIARELNVTRSQVWQWVERLRNLGCEIQGVPATGYRLKKMPDLLAPELVRRELGTSSFGKTIHHFLEIDSTNDYATQLAISGGVEGTVVLAEGQKSGRGRMGRQWYSEPLKGIYCSVILRPGLPPAKGPLLTLAAALAVRDAVCRMTDLKMDIRWPNDLMIGGKKFCGILAEMSAEVGRIRFVVMGIGVNVNHTSFPKEISHLATSLKLETGKTWSRIELTGQMLKRLESLCREMEKAGGQGIINRWSEISSFAEHKRVEVHSNGTSFFGETAGLDENGFLRVKRDDGCLETIYSGSIAEANEPVKES
ncbi:MAG: biotin--[acetyl-CoA-carboxylase] ligase [Acidobacteriia bacterium]|nr:biotin--[acetyl-CoA-carboxylase] ligase [Terriglobia bacterium]